MHGFLFNKRGGLSVAGEEMPRIREHINQLRDLTATFKMRDIPGEDVSGKDVHGVSIEFLKSWKMSEEITKQRHKSTYINPNYIHKNQYSDSIVECGCGALMSRPYDNDTVEVRPEHDHSDECKGYERDEARLKLREKRWETIKKLYWLGWESKEIAPRLNMTEDQIHVFINEMDSSSEELRKSYHRAGGNTYHHLVQNEGIDPNTVSDIYDKHRRTMNGWYKDHGDEWVKDFKYESSKGTTTEWQGEYWDG